VIESFLLTWTRSGSKTSQAKVLHSYHIIIIIDSLIARKKNLNLDIHLYQCTIIPIASKIKTFLDKDKYNSIYFWYCPRKLKWPRQAMIDKEVKVSNYYSVLPSKNSFLFIKKKEYDNILESWQTLFQDSKKRDQLFLDFKNNKEQVLKPTYIKGGL